MRYFLPLLLLFLTGCATNLRLAGSPAHTRRAYEHHQRVNQRVRARLHNWK